MTRVDDDGGVLKLHVVKERLDVTGVHLTEDITRSFGLWYSVMTGRLPSLDVSLLRREQSQFFWASWPDIASTISARIQDYDKDAMCLFAAEVRAAHQSVDEATAVYGAP